MLKRLCQSVFPWEGIIKDELTIKTVQEEITEVTDFNFLGDNFDSQLRFYKPIKKLWNRSIWNVLTVLAPTYIPLNAAHLFMHAVIFSHVFILLWYYMEPGITVNWHSAKLLLVSHLLYIHFWTALPTEINLKLISECLTKRWNTKQKNKPLITDHYLCTSKWKWL